MYEWLYELGKEPRIITDGSTEVLDDLIVTTVPYFCYREQKAIWLDRGASIRRQRGSPWLVLHHIPPIAYPGSTREETEAAELLLAYRPDYFVSGHSHQFPYFPGKSWAEVVNDVQVLVPGQLLSAPFPNHIVLNTVSKEAAWETSSREWIPEDGLYDHLATGVRSQNHSMRPVEFGKALAVGTRLTFFSEDKPDRFFRVIKFWMDKTSGIASH